MREISKLHDLMEKGINFIFMLCGIVAIGFVICITIHLIISGLPAIMEIGVGEFLLGTVWQPTATTTTPSFGILPLIFWKPERL